MNNRCIKIEVTGIVQGCGFRPYIKKLADSLSIFGSVINTIGGVEIIAFGNAACIKTFVETLDSHPQVESLTMLETSPSGSFRESFQIYHSEASELSINQCLIPDRVPCERCQKDMLSIGNRRQAYAFTSCAECGPRYSISLGSPFERSNTSFKHFQRCEKCEQEYNDSENRRFYAQTISCPSCGPDLSLKNAEGVEIETNSQFCIQTLAKNIAEGHVVAIKGTSGFHIVADPNNKCAVEKIRELKSRPSKPLALMYPDLDLISRDCYLSAQEKSLLKNKAGPLTLLRSRKMFSDVAPNNAYLAVMLPPNSLYFLLQQFWGKALIVTSANRKGETLIGSIDELLESFPNTFSAILDHDLKIHQPVDDSIAQIVEHAPMLLRPARGYTPLKLNLDDKTLPCLGLGTYLKNTVAMVSDKTLFLSPFIGDLESKSVLEKRDLYVNDFLDRCGKDVSVVGDTHREFPFPAGLARSQISTVQHHLAHAFACEYEHGVQAPYLAVTWDGLGFGMGDNKLMDSQSTPNVTELEIWGGEFFTIGETSYDRAASLKPIMLVGGDQAQKEPRRIALAMLSEIESNNLSSVFLAQCDSGWSEREIKILSRLLSNRSSMNKTGLVTSSAMGRLIDGLASMLNLCHINSFEGEAAMILQSKAQQWLISQKAAQASEATMDKKIKSDIKDLNYDFFQERNMLRLDWRPMVVDLMDRKKRGVETGEIAFAVWQTLVSITLDVARIMKQHTVVVSGGCFQNRLLLELLNTACKNSKIACYWPQKIPPNDSGIAVGQIAAFLKQHSNRAEQTSSDTVLKKGEVGCV